MFEKYTSEKLLQAIPRPVLNFIWYLWDTYGDPKSAEFRVTLRSEKSGGQQFTVHSTEMSVTQDFKCSIDAELAVRRCGARVFMEHVET